MQGRIQIESQLGQGTGVRVSLPMPDRPSPHGDAPSPAVATLPSATMPLADDPTGVVLYIEDNPVNLMVVEELLARWPEVRLVQAGDGAAGLALARSMRPDLVLLDMRLPDMDGIDVLAGLRSDDATRDLRVIVLSASAMPDDVTAARRAGAYDYWTKPLDFDHFLRELRRLLATPTVSA
jgi:CheY-like chemotaxis protein